MRHDDYATCARLSRSMATPLQLGENFAGARAMSQALATGACDMVMPDLERIGGVSGWMEAAALASVHELPMSSHLFPEISAHLLAATPTAHWLEYVDWADAILQQPLRVEGGTVRASRAPGCGLAWDEDAVARFAMH